MRGAFFTFLLLLFIIVFNGCNRGKEKPEQSEGSADLNMELMSLDVAPIRITVPAKQFDWDPTKLQPLPSKLIAEGKDTTITLVPYNLTKFRVSMFPVTKSSWKEH